jgi:hypothetical protein
MDEKGDRRKMSFGGSRAIPAWYINTLFKHQAAISMNKYDLGLARDFSHRI